SAPPAAGTGFASLPSKQDRASNSFGKGSAMREHPLRFHPAVEALEGRDTPAVNAFIQGNTLVILGTNGADMVLLSQQNNQLVLSQPGVADQLFRLNELRGVVFRGLGGADAFLNTTGVPTTAFGGPGSDLLVGGAGANRLFGEGGDDVLVGNLG